MSELIRTKCHGTGFSPSASDFPYPCSFADAALSYVLHRRFRILAIKNAFKKTHQYIITKRDFRATAELQRRKLDFCVKCKVNYKDKPKQCESVVFILYHSEGHRIYSIKFL
jgi:hypothetical protein